MANRIKSHIFLSSLLIFIFGTYMNAQPVLSHIQNRQDVVALFPTKPEEIAKRVTAYIADAKEQLNALLAISPEKRTFENTIVSFDDITSLSNMSVFASVIHIITMVHPDLAMREAAQAAERTINIFRVDSIVSNGPLYQAFKEYAEGNALRERLTDDQWYYVRNLLADCKRNGLNLSDAKRAEIAQLQKEIDLLSVNFGRAVADDTSHITVSREELAGLAEEFINGLPHSDEGVYTVGTDYPTYTGVMESCAVEETRKALYRAFQNRAYPANDVTLQELCAKRAELAHLLGFPTFAHLNIDDCMAGSPEKVETFLYTLLTKAEKKEASEFRILTQDLPPAVSLLPDGTMQPWDVGYVKACYKKEHFALDEQLIAEYFPQDSTVRGLLDIYRAFFSIEFKEVPIAGLWHEEVTLIEVYAQDGKELLGYLLLDLYPRPHKYNHACECTIVPAVASADGSKPPAVVLVIANFARPTAHKPALWHRTQAVQTFFHEFGHALHDLLGRTPLAGTAGTNVKLDFVELPSQMLERWLYNAAILKGISKHYLTGEPLPDTIIEKIKATEQFDSGYAVQRQIIFALLSLAYYQDDTGKPLYDTMVELYAKISHHIAFDPENHFYASFGHLTGYAARYYGYLWSQVFALDLFGEIEKHGLLNSEIGQRYVQEILSKGGSKDPNELLRNFLGREPNQDAFLKNLGFTKTQSAQLAIEVADVKSATS